MLGWRSHNTKDEHYLDVARVLLHGITGPEEFDPALYQRLAKGQRHSPGKSGAADFRRVRDKQAVPGMIGSEAPDPDVPKPYPQLIAGVKLQR
jgi:hypothetical protein